jgi:hypothetical protein
MKIVYMVRREYSSKEEVGRVLGEYGRRVMMGRRILICGHGRGHIRHSYLPIEGSILLDIDGGVRPDIVGDMRDRRFMERMPAGYFDEIYVVYTPPPNPLDDRIWRNMWRLVREGGRVRTNYVIHVYKSGNKDISLMKELISGYFVGRWIVRYEGIWIILTKRRLGVVGRVVVQPVKKETERKEGIVVRPVVVRGKKMSKRMVKERVKAERRDVIGVKRMSNSYLAEQSRRKKIE